MRAIVIIFIGMMVCSCKTIDNIDSSKYPMITTAKELSEYYDLLLDTTGRHETSKITKYFDGSVDLEYTYDFLETEEYDPLFYSVTIDKERTVSDALQTYVISKGAVKLVMNSGVQGSTKIESLDLPGDDNFYALRTYNGEPNGIYFTMRQGKVVYTIIMSGLYSEDHGLLLDLILPKIEKLEFFEIE